MEREVSKLSKSYHMWVVKNDPWKYPINHPKVTKITVGEWGTPRSLGHDMVNCGKFLCGDTSKSDSLIGAKLIELWGVWTKGVGPQTGYVDMEARSGRGVQGCHMRVGKKRVRIVTSEESRQRLTPIRQSSMFTRDLQKTRRGVGTSKTAAKRAENCRGCENGGRYPLRNHQCRHSTIVNPPKIA